ncbi:tight adherence protein B [Tepidamorphus gemmatus]|jgi:tight adherence protein B|uniref:Tight adherence protein B n=1 Tax=Tepidamorphus gemmatus TaxID=747076 RepID=A0A4R3M2J5_9HYPH|nr:type II secretion system F family protein [Tepidamorphus gemmatus]TCT07222.1 tight adherence protein B [Tepidamorphus gemmatus]
MLGADIQVLAVIAMAMICAGGLAWVFIYPRLSGEAAVEKRIRTVRASRIATPASQKSAFEVEVSKRRKQIQETLKDLEAKQKQRARPPLRVRIGQAGLGWSVRTYYVVSVATGIAAGLAGLLARLPPLVILGLMIAGGVGLPHWMLGFLKKRRQNKFLNEFPTAVDIVVRGVKAGLPLNDCLRIVAAESQEPVRSEFRQVIETQALGLPVADCVERMYDRMPLPEVNFFAIVIAIQQKTGGNLAEALSNLSKVLRDRKRMKGKIQAMSQEAKASAAIIGALPIIVMILVFLTSPQYISLLWTEPVGHIMLAGSAFWMLCGILVMRKMINFDF